MWMEKLTESFRRVFPQAIRSVSEVSTYTGKKPKIVILGSGWGSFNFLHTIDKSKYHVTCISPANHFLFTPLLPSSALGTVEFRSIQEPIRAIKGMAGHYLQAKATSINFETQRIYCEEIFHLKCFEVDYDLLIVATGNKTNTFNVKNIAEREGKEVFFLKNLWHARQIRNRILECFERAAIPSVEEADRKRLLSFIVVGGGPTSVEFVGELNDFLKEDVGRFYPELKNHIAITIVEAGKTLMSSFDNTLISYVQTKFNLSGTIKVKLNTSVTGLSEDGHECTLSDGTTMPVGMMVWSAGLSPVRFVEQLNLEKVGGAKRLEVDDQLFVVNRKKTKGRVMALGDCAVNKEVPLAPLAQVARSQGLWLAGELNKLDLNEDDDETPQEKFQQHATKFSYFHMGSMATLGGWRGVVDLSSVGDKSHHVNLGRFSGLISFIVWRSAYLGRQVSLSNKLLIPVYWMKTWIFGRDISRF